jgi:hypothetical protein
MLPRIQGKVGQAENGPHPGKWYFEMWLTSIGGGEGQTLGLFGPWESEQEAKTELQRACKMAVEAIETKMGNGPSGKYIDMKTNTVRKWDRSDEN